MKIVFESSLYTLDQLKDLLENYPEADKLIQFISDWQSGETSFRFYTSGSTGTPKPIEISRQQIVASVEATAKYLSLQKKFSVLLCLNPDFIASVMMVARCLIVDMDLIIQRPTANPMKDITESIDFAAFVPIQIYKMMEEGTLSKLSMINRVIIGGAPLSGLAFDALSKIDTDIYQTYGMTETVSHIALMPVKGNFASATFHILDEVLIEQDLNCCLRAKGAVTCDRWIQTNDIIERINENEFLWLGRYDHTINSGGIKIHPEQLEKELENVLGQQLEYIISWEKNERVGMACVLLIENDTLSEEGFKNVQKTILDKFSKYHVPKAVYSLAQFARTDSGKIKREETRLLHHELG
ncbi:MAG: AMP-binding protein [Reichenbachiella sp.]|uniref:AMP-binding protein n=1 Tax=Reichenbachiella sp. TaxID=2184521 RepID=UPI0032652987